MKSTPVSLNMHFGGNAHLQCDQEGELLGTKGFRPPSKNKTILSHNFIREIFFSNMCDVSNNNKLMHLINFRFAQVSVDIQFLIRKLEFVKCVKKSKIDSYLCNLFCHLVFYLALSDLFPHS